MSRSGVNGKGMDVMEYIVVDVWCIVGVRNIGIVVFVCMGNGVYGCEEGSGI
jgi:hypothetical protein